MINRATLECKACGTRVVTRTAIGHGTSQTHTFPCPGCGVPIVFTLHLDQEKIEFEYGRTPTNAIWVDDESGAVMAVAFDSEALVPRGAPVVTPAGEMVVSPFIVMATLMRDIGEFKREFDDQLMVIKHRGTVRAK